MHSSHLIIQTKTLWKTLQKTLQQLQVDKNNPLEYAQFALMETDEAIRTIKSWVITHDFDCWESEITFFKNLKPLFTSKFIYYSKVIALLSSMPHSGTKVQKRHLEGEFDYLNYFSLENRDFISYYRRKATYLDLKYFMRFKYDLDVKLAPDFHNYDERFSTSHDQLIATILAHDQYELFLKKQLQQLKETPPGEPSSSNGLQWTAPKVALTELVFALHHTHCFNGGTTSLAETVKCFEEAFSVDLGNYHNTMAEIRNRKSNPTKFLNQLSANLTAYLEKDDGIPL